MTLILTIQSYCNVSRQKSNNLFEIGLFIQPSFLIVHFWTNLQKSPNQQSNMLRNAYLKFSMMIQESIRNQSLIIITRMKSYNVILPLFLVLTLTISKAAPKLSSNYNTSVVNDFAMVSIPLQVPLPLTRNSEPLSSTPINQKYNIYRYQPLKPNIQVQDLSSKMTSVDYEMIQQEQAPSIIFEDKHNEEYYLLQNRQFFLTINNPSEVFTLCVTEIFSDCQNIKRATKRNFPICVNSYTKYPFYFNIYVTSFKSRQVIRAGIFFNVTIKHESHVVTRRLWMKQVNFMLNPNHLKLVPFELKNCRDEQSVVSIKNPEKVDLSFLLIYKYKKFNLNGTPLDDKFTITGQKIFKFLIEGRDSTMTVYTQNSGSSERTYPVLYVPVYCLENLVVENVPIGIISAQNLALTYPIMVSSHSQQLINIQEIQLISSSSAVEIVRNSISKAIIHTNEKFVQIGTFIIRSTRNPHFKNTMTIRVRYSLMNHQNVSQWSETTRLFGYCELYDPISIGNNRFYDMTQLKDVQYNQTQKIIAFNYSVTNRLQIPIRMERILFNSANFRMNWFRYNGLYIFPDQVKEEIFLEYIGPKNLSVSPAKFVVAIQFTGGIFLPFEVSVFDHTLVCLHQGKEQRCSALKNLNFGNYKNQQKQQSQLITIRNMNPSAVELKMDSFDRNTSQYGIIMTVGFQQPFPFYQPYIRKVDNQIFVDLKSGHYINLMIQIQILENPLSGQIPLILETAHERIAPLIKFNFQQGKLTLEPEVYNILQSDRLHRGFLQVSSTFQQSYQIKEITTLSNVISFSFNQSQEYQQNARVLIPFLYSPHLNDNNITSGCCGEQFLKNQYLTSLINFQVPTTEIHEITLITNTEHQKRMSIEIQPNHESLLHEGLENRKIQFNVLRLASKSQLYLHLKNPYPTAMKYNIFFMPEEIIYKPKDFMNYFKYSRKQKVQAYFCFKNQGKNANYFTSNTLKQLFHLEEKPIEISLSRSELGNINPNVRQQNLSFNEYVHGIIKTGQNFCYKIQTTLYFKLLIQSEIVNHLLKDYPLEIVEKFMEKQHQHSLQASIVLNYDDFYSHIHLKFKKFCNSAFFPIFRFCFHYPLQLVPPNTDSISDGSSQKRIHKRQGRLRSGYILQQGSSHELCLNIMDTSESSMNFQLVVVNNYSRYDDYKVKVTLVQPKITIGDISFQQNSKINNQIFIKHYFPTLSKLSSKQLEHIHDAPLSRNKIIPLYLTNQDYDEQFSLFRGQRYFQLVNHSPIDVNFTHFGFNDKENIIQFEGLRIQQILGNQSLGNISLRGNEKSTFRVTFNIDTSLKYNLSNPLFHHRVNLYLYRSHDYYIELQLLIKIADNVIGKLQTHNVQKQGQQNQLFYIFINFLSLGFICVVILLFKRQETIKNNKLKIAMQKQTKIIHKQLLKDKKQDLREPFIEENQFENKINRRSHNLPPEAIGNRISYDQGQIRYRIHCTISEEDLGYFKSLKVKEDKSIVSESSESEPFLRLSLIQEDRGKTSEEEKSLEKQKIDRDDYSKQTLSERHSQQSGQFQLEDEESESEQSQRSLTESMLPDGISVYDQLDTIDEFTDEDFGFEAQKPMKKQAKMKKEDEYGYYNVFSSHNPLKKEKDTKENPFPWMNKNNERKKAPRPKHRKVQKELI